MMLEKNNLLSAFPKDSAAFDGAVDRALEQIHREAASERANAGGLRLRRVAAWAMACCLMLAGAWGIAEGVRHGVFDFLHDQQEVLPQATELVRNDVAQMRVGHTDIRATQVVFDGAAVRFVLELTNDTMTRPVTQEEIDGDIYGAGELGEALKNDGVTALGSFDWFTIDGKEYSMTGDSSQSNVPGENNGEVLVYFELLLTSSAGEKVVLPEGDFVLGIPVCNGETLQSSQLMIPIDRAADDLLRDLTPTAPMSFDGGAYTVTVTQAWLSPVRSAVELRVDVGDAISEEAAWAAISPWYDIALVDEQGAQVGTSERNYWGKPVGETDEARHFIIRIEIAPQESYPDRLFVAPMGSAGADMRYAVELDGEGK